LSLIHCLQWENRELGDRDASVYTENCDRNRRLARDRRCDRVVDAPFGKRPFRVHIDPSQDGCEVVNGVADRVRREMFFRIGLEDLLHPSDNRARSGT
jgi:hypothetical protein